MRKLLNSPMSLIAITYMASSLIGCAAGIPTREVTHGDIWSRDVWTGYTIDSITDASPGSIVASIQNATTKIVKFIEGDPIFYMASPCVIEYPTQRVNLGAGFHNDVKITQEQEPVYLLKLDRQYSNGTRFGDYIGVNQNGTIGNLYSSAVPIMNFGVGNVNIIDGAPKMLDNSRCQFQISHANKSEEKHFNTRLGNISANIIFEGRNETGILQFGYLTPSGLRYNRGTALVPAKPGVYGVDGLKISILRVSGYDITYKILDPAPMSEVLPIY
jgi:hypothetical protein